MNVKKIFAVIYASYAVARRNPEKHSSFHLRLSGYITNQFANQFSVDLLAQLVEQCTGVAEVFFESRQARIFSGFLFATA